MKVDSRPAISGPFWPRKRTPLPAKKIAAADQRRPPPGVPVPAGEHVPADRHVEHEQPDQAGGLQRQLAERHRRGHRRRVGAVGHQHRDRVASTWSTGASR